LLNQRAKAHTGSNPALGAFIFMKFKQLGKTKEKIPVIGLGTWEIEDTAEQVKALKTGLKMGARFIDTAEYYNTEHIVAKAIQNETDVFIATKVTPSHFSYDNIIKACDASLKKLGVKTIDLYQLHWPNPSISIKETMRAMEHLVEVGKIRYIGISNFSLKRTKEAQEALKNNEIVSNQVIYNPFAREIEKDLIPFCEKEKITVIAYSPLDRGSILKRNPEIMKVINDIADKHNKSSVQVTLNWLCSRKSVVAIPKASTVAHTKDNVESVEWTLKEDEIKRIDNASSGFSYPNWGKTILNEL
jgi:diketogulonate reductase-like aldo/keto reductase